MSKGSRTVDVLGTDTISGRFVNERLLVFSIFKATRVMIMLTLVGVFPILYTQTAFSQTTLNCDLPGHASCYSSGYSAGLVNKGVSCSSTLLKGTTTQVNDYCSGYMAAQQQQLQQQR
ncbi:MAG: hypothetical protein WBZ36_08800 [Candidatus Nitrosopolaris sp.]